MVRSSKLANLLSQHMQTHHLKDIRLAKRVEEVFKRPIVSASSIRNWRNGTAQTVRDWRQLLAVANVLSLTQAETDELLKTASLPTIQELWVCAGQNDEVLFRPWILENDETRMARLGTALDLVSSEKLSCRTEPSPTLSRHFEKIRAASKSLPTSSYIPLRPFPLYTGRYLEMERLAKTLLSEEPVAVHPPVAITGIGGIGKTQLAVEFAYLYGHYFPGGVFLLNFDQPDAIATQVALCGSLVGLDLRPDYDTLPLEKQCQLVQRAWQEPTPRLLIFDSCDEAMLKKWRPAWGGARILVTSRRENWDPALGVKTLPLQVLLREESTLFLRKFLSDLPHDEADKIADLLGDHPLALRLAGHFLHCYQADVTPVDYLQQLTRLSECQESQLWEHCSLKGRSHTSPETASGSRMSLQQTFSLSYEKLDLDLAVDMLAREILMYITCLPPNEPVPRKLIGMIVELASNPNKIAEEDSDTLLIADALGRLSALGLIQCNPRQKSVWMHQLVVDFIKGMRDDASLAVVEQAIIDEVEKRTETNDPASLRGLEVHLRHLARAARPRRDERAAGLYNALGDYLLIVGAYQEACTCLEWALAVREELLGLDHPDTATTMDYLGYTYHLMGNLQKAGVYYQRALAVNCQQLGFEHKNTARSYHFLGMFYNAKGENEQAKECFNQALLINEKILPVNHPHIAFTLNGLGILTQSMGDFHQAANYFKRSLSILEITLGYDHPDVATTLYNLGRVYEDMGDMAAAQTYIEQALATAQKSLKADHPSIALFLKGLGNLHQTLGRTQNAKTYFSQALTIYERTFGQEHEKTKQLQTKLLEV